MKKLLENIFESEVFYFIMLFVLICVTFLPRVYNKVQEANLKAKETLVKAESLERAIQEEIEAGKDK